MAENLSRFVIIDGVQIEKGRAKRLGLVDDAGDIIKHKGKVSPRAAADASPTEPVDDDTPPTDEEVAAVSDLDDAPAVEQPSVETPSGRRARGSGSARRG